jgi:glycosyltransferase involved in cell wall biosynthesis
MKSWLARRGALRRLTNGVNGVFADIGTNVRVLQTFARESRKVTHPEPESPRQFSDLSRRLLVISHYSPPYRSAVGTQRLAKYIKYLDRWGWRITLITTEPGKTDERDEEAEQLADSVEVIRLPRTELRSWRSQTLTFPDDHINWIEPAVSAASEVLARDRFDCILSTAPPYSNALAATICAGMSGVPFVPDFRDPWSRIDHGWVIKSPTLRIATAALERRVLRASSRVTMCVRMPRVESFFTRVPEDTRRRVVSVPNGFDNEDFARWDEMRPAQSDKFVISYIGSIYDEKTLRALMDPLEEWRRRYPKEFEDVTLDYAGTSSSRFDKHKLRPSYLRDRGFLPHPRAIELKAQSSVQLFCLPASMSAHVLSGKIFEMIRTGIPIIAIVRPDSDVVDLIKETETGVAVQYGKPEQAMQALRQYYAQWREGKATIQPNWKNIEQYSRELLARQMERVIIDASLRRTPMPLSHQTAPDPARGLVQPATE